MQKKGKTKKAEKKESKTNKIISKNLVYFISLLLVISVLLVSSQLNQRQTIRSNAQTADCNVSDTNIDAEEKKMMDMINSYRQQKGVAALALDQTLTRVAVWNSTDMDRRKQLDHTDSLGRDIFTRRSDCGYFDGGSENIGTSDDGSAQYTFDWWRNSTQGHNEVMLDSRSVIAGISRVGAYWTLETGQEGTANPPQSGGQVDPTTAPGVPITSSPSDPSTVPNPNCLGSCPTSGVPYPTEALNTNPGGNNASITPAPGSESGGGASGQNKDLLGIFLDIIRLILEFLASMFK